MSQTPDHASGDAPEAQPPEPPRRVWTIPNGLCVVRLVGSAGVVGLAVANQPTAVLWLFLVLAATDLVDGRLAIWLGQRSAFGAIIDSVADAAMYGSLLFALAWLEGETLGGEAVWLAAAILSFLGSWAYAYWKFRRWPSYHTRSAKTAWLLTVIAAVILFFGQYVWPLRIAMTAVLIANVESILITASLSQWRSDVKSIREARRR